MDHVVLLGFQRRRMVFVLLGFSAFSTLVLVTAYLTLNGDSSGGRKVFGAVAAIAGLLGTLGALALLASNLMRQFAVVEADSESIRFVAPIGLGWLNSSGRLDRSSVDVPELRRSAARRGRLTEFEIVLGDQVIKASLDESSLEEDFEARFAERSRLLPRSEAPSPPDE